MLERIKVILSPRPETPEEESECLSLAYRAELERVADALGLPGSPNLTCDLAPAVRKLTMRLAKLESRR